MMAQITRNCGTVRRTGLSLLEVMLSLAILGGALAVIGELTRLGSRSAEIARDETIAQRLCENKLAEIAAGLVFPTAVTMAPVEELEDQNEWLYTIEIQQLQQTGLIGVWVTVQQNADTISRPVTFTLVRWMIDPQSSTTTTDESASGATGSTSSTSSGSTGSSAATGGS
jgi:type II secretory pathway pseudopilin PulG